MRYQGLIIACMWLLPQCAAQKEDATPASVLWQEILDPNLYTMTAYVLTGPLVDQNNFKIAGQWLDGGGDFIRGSDNRLNRFRHALSADQRYQSLQFKIAVNDAEASSGPLSFKDCDFADTLGYPAADFKHMILNYNFLEGGIQGDSVSGDPQPVPQSLATTAVLERAPLGSSGPDDLAVQCERIKGVTRDRVITLRVRTSPDQLMKIEKEGKTVVPMVLSRESYTTSINQEFSFDFPTSTPVADASIAIKVRSPKGEHNYQVSFQRCIATVGNGQKDLIVSQEHGLYVDENGVVRDGGDIMCCLSNGMCHQQIFD